MKEPKAYKDIQVDWTPLTPGGHKCVLKEVQEVQSSTGKAMLKISFDTAKDDTQPNYFSNQYLADQKAGKTGDKLKWRGVGYLIVDEGTDYGPRNLKRFNTAVVDSNPGFQIVWGDGYGPALKDKLVGIVFREEEYTREDFTFGYSTKAFRYCNYEKALDQEAPPRKDLPRDETQKSAGVPSEWVNAPVNEKGYWDEDEPKQMSFSAASNEGFMKIPADALEDEGLPFK